MLFSNDETYVITEVQNKCGYRSRVEAEEELAINNVVGKPMGATIVYHGRALNDMILRVSTTHAERGAKVKRRKQKRTPGGKFAATACSKCSTKMVRGECPECD